MLNVTIDEIKVDIFLERILSNVIEHPRANRILQIGILFLVDHTKCSHTFIQGIVGDSFRLKPMPIF